VIALIAALSPLANADIIVTGVVTPITITPPPPVTGTVSGTLFVGNGAPGTLAVDAASTLTANSLSVANGGTGSGTVTIIGTTAGPQTIVNLTGPSDLVTIRNPLEVGQWGIGTMTVSGGAIINGAITGGVPNANCLSNLCNNFIGQTAGSSGTLTLQDVGTTASFGGGFFVGNASVSPGFGTSGGSATGIVNVQSGAVLNTYSATLGNVFVSGTPNGETASAQVTVDGAGSSWQVTRNLVTGAQAQINIAGAPNATGTIDVTGGGQLVVTGSRPSPATDSSVPGINMSAGAGGGTSTLNVGGPGSAVVINGDTGFFNVGRVSATAHLNITDGGTISGGGTNGLVNMNVARSGSNATLNVDGAGSQLTLSGICGLNTGCDNHGAFLSLGRDTGSVATATVTSGGAILIRDGGQAASGGGLGLLIGWDSGLGPGSGSLTVSGATSRVTVEQTGAGTTNPFIIVGQAGTGTMTVTDGAKAAVNGTAERDLVVGNAVGGSGTLTVSNGAAISASWFAVGNNGGTGTATIIGTGIANVNNPNVLINGLAVNPDNTVFGGSIRVGRGTGSVGTLNLENGAQITLNTSIANSSINLGGTGVLPGGNGTIHMSGGSSISFVGSGATPSVNIGHSGTGLFTTTGNSTLSLPDDGSIVLGNRASGSGTLQLGGGSSIGTGFLTVGNSGQGSVTMTGGTLNVHTTSVHDTDTFVVGANSGSVGTFSQSAGVVNADDGLSLGLFAGSSGSYTLTGGTLNSRNMDVGDRGTGVFINSDPVLASTVHNVTGNLVVGGDTTGNGSYTITGNSAQTNVKFALGGNGPTDPPGANGYDPITTLPRPAPNGGLGVGVGGIGTFTQGAANFSDPGNAVAVAGDLVVGVFAGGVGTYTLNTGALTVGGKVVVGAVSQGANVFTQNGGSVTVTGAAFGNPNYVGLGGNDFSGSLTVGGGVNDVGGGTGTYVHNGGTVTASLVQVGLSGTGTFNQTGGTVASGGNTIVGDAGTGVFNNSGGVHTVGGDLVLGNQTSGNGTYNLSATGVVDVSGSGQRIIVGAAGTGTFNQSGGAATAYGLSVGNNAGGSGTYNLSGASSQLTVSGNVSIGAVGSGTMKVSGGAGITLTGAGASVVIGQSGTGVMTMIEGSRLILPTDGTVIVGANAGASGTLELQGGSSIQAGALFGIAHNGTASTGATANVYVDSGSSITATTIYLGDGCLGGNGGVLHGNLIMDGVARINCSPPVLPVGIQNLIGPLGILHPGRSPGVLTIDGGFQFISGTIELQVQSDGLGGFLTDEIVFTNGSVLDLTKANIEFLFVGKTDPNAFAASTLWDLDTFFKTVVPGPDGGIKGISALGDLDTLFSDAEFVAQSDAYVIEEFSFNPGTGVNPDFVAVPVSVPEPGTMVLVLLGSALLVLFARRRESGLRVRLA
jgi:T5SS/PEP-CTERM-associated repeat protein